MTLSRLAFLAGALATSLAFMSGAGAQETVKIGAAVSLTGNFAREGNLLKNGYAYWEKLVNEAGGIDVAGKKTKVEVIYYDDESKPQSSARLT
jgi:branched-chain amino acid transport system substrate-binding protein